MENKVPILDANGVVQIDSLGTFVEVLDAVTEGQWLMVAPRMTVRLQADLEFKVRFGDEQETVTVIGTPYYWRGPFVGMKVRPASSADLNRARQLSQRLLHRAESTRASEARGSPETSGHTSYAMVEPVAESVFGGGPDEAQRPATETGPIAEAVPEQQPAAEVEAAPPAPAPPDPEPDLPPEPAAEPATEPAAEVEVAAPAIADPEPDPLPEPAAEPESAVKVAASATAEPEPDNLPAPVPAAETPSLPDIQPPPAEEFVPVAPTATAAPATPAPEGDPSDYTETEYLAIEGAASPFAPDSAPPESPPVAAPEPVQAPAEAAPVRRPAAGRSKGADASSAIPELRGTTVGGFTNEGLLISFPDKQSGLPLPDSPTLYRVLSLLAAYEVSGQLTLKQGDGEAQFFVRKGTLLGIEPLGQSFDEHFAKHLLAEKAIEQEPLEAAIAHAQAFDKTLPVALYEKRSIGMDVMGRFLREIKQTIFFELVSNTEPFDFHFVARRKFGRKFDPMRVHLAGTLVEFVRTMLARKYLADLEPLLLPYKFKYAQVHDSPVIPIDVLNLDDKQRHAVKHVFHGPNRLNEAYSLCLLTRHGTARLITLLHHFGLINWLDEPGEVAGQETIEDRLKTNLRHLEAGDHFKRMEVHWGAHPRKLETSLDRFRGKYGPEQPLSRHSPEATELCAKIMGVVMLSYDFLADKRQRRAYRLETQGDMRVKRAAEFLVKQSDLVRFRGDWEEAFDLLEAAIDMWEHPSFVTKHKAWRAEYKGN